MKKAKKETSDIESLKQYFRLSMGEYLRRIDEKMKVKTAREYNNKGAKDVRSN